MTYRLLVLPAALVLASFALLYPALGAEPPARQSAAETQADETGDDDSPVETTADDDTPADEASADTENPGQSDLDHAVEMKLGADDPQELAEVIVLCQRALDKGLDEANTDFANNLLASALVQRGRMVAEAIFAPPQPDPRWPQLRQLALGDLNRALKHVPEQPAVSLLIGKLESLPGGDRKRALSALEDAIDSSEREPGLQYEALMLHAGLDDTPAGRVKDLDRAVKLRPEDPVPLRLRGSLKLSQGKPEESIEDFDAAIKLDPKNAATFEIRGLALAMLKRLDEARESYSHAVELAPKSPALLLQQAQISFLGEKFEQAVEDATQALKLDPKNIGGLLLRAQALARTNQLKLALADIEQVLDLQPRLVPALRARALILSAQGDTAGAIRDLSFVAVETPDDLEVQFQLAMLYRTQKNFVKALELLEGALTDDPDNWFLHYGRADILLGVGRHAEAKADYEISYKINAEESGLLNNFAWLLATSPDPKVRDGKRAVELATAAAKATEYKQAHILSTLAAAYAEAGDYEAAEKWSQKSVEIAKDDATRDNLKKELASYTQQRPWRELLHDDTTVSQVPADTKSPDAPGKIR